MLGMKLIDLHKRYIEWWQRKLYFDRVTCYMAG